MSVYLELNKKNYGARNGIAKQPKLKMTYNYNLFTNDPTNRNVTKVGTLVQSMKEYGFLPAYPIHVVYRNGQLFVKDGGHRLAAAKITKNPVYYVVLEDIDISIPQINSGQTPWSGADYVDSYIKRGLEEYIKLSEFCRRYRIPLTIAAPLLLGRQPNAAAYITDIRRGTFKVKNEQMANQIMLLVEAIRPFFKQAASRFFIGAIYRCFMVKEFDHVRFCKKAKKHRHLFEHKATIDDYLAVIEQVYNEQARKNDRIPLKFMANQAAEKKAIAGRFGN